jgi:phosphatidylglycerophosphate synthase
LEVRRQPWVRRLARSFVRAGITPNQISLASIGLAAAAAAAYGSSIPAYGFLKGAFLAVAAALIQLRLLANLLDGLMAVEEGQRTAAGPIYNELPDRAADSLFLVAAGYASGWNALGWAAALLAAIVAYVRQLGGSLGLKQDFCGPMAKQHRMAMLSAGSIAAAFFPNVPFLALALMLIVTGSCVTFWRRTRRIVDALEVRPHPSADD